MRRAAVFAVLILFIMYMIPGVWALTSAGDARLQATVSADGSCQVTLTAVLNADSADGELLFPLPADATDISVNGIRPVVWAYGDAVSINLTQLLGAVSGPVTVTFSYTLPSVVTHSGGQSVLTLPLLCGFAYPVESFQFSVTLPGDVTSRPAFSSIYYQSVIEQQLTFSVDGSVITGSLPAGLMDLDRLTMTLPVTEEMFPRGTLPRLSMDMADTGMLIFAGLALVYWLCFMSCLPTRRVSQVSAPEGVTPADVAAVLTRGKKDLSLLVLYWAQLGYLGIHMDNRGRILLRKRMEMGNERSGFENRIFRNLFAKRATVDGTGYHFARLHRKVSVSRPDIPGLFRKGSGSALLLRLLAAAAGILGGISLGGALGSSYSVQGVLAGILGAFGGISAWYIQAGAGSLCLRHKRRIWLAFFLSAGWVGLGIAANAPAMGLCMPAGQYLAGLAAFYGGRRTEYGRFTAGQLLGLRQYLRTANKPRVQRTLQTNPEYYYTMAPYALAMGVDQAFAGRFDDIALTPCSYLTTQSGAYSTAKQWNRLLREVVRRLDARQKHLFWEHLTGK